MNFDIAVFLFIAIWMFECVSITFVFEVGEIYNDHPEWDLKTYVRTDPSHFPKPTKEFPDSNVVKRVMEKIGKFEQKHSKQIYQQFKVKHSITGYKNTGEQSLMLQSKLSAPKYGEHELNSATSVSHSQKQLTQDVSVDPVKPVNEPDCQKKCPLLTLHNDSSSDDRFLFSGGWYIPAASKNFFQLTKNQIFGPNMGGIDDMELSYICPKINFLKKKTKDPGHDDYSILYGAYSQSIIFSCIGKPLLGLRCRSIIAKGMKKKIKIRGQNRAPMKQKRDVSSTKKNVIDGHIIETDYKSWCLISVGSHGIKNMWILLTLETHNYGKEFWMRKKAVMKDYGFDLQEAKLSDYSSCPILV